MLQMMKAVKLDNKMALAVSQSYNIPKTNLYRLLKEYDEQMGADDVTEEKLKMFVESKKKSGGQTVS